MTTLAAFYGLPRIAVPPLEVTVARMGNGLGRWMICFVEDGVLSPSATTLDDPPVPISYIDARPPRAEVWGYARKWIAQGLTVIYRSDLEQ